MPYNSIATQDDVNFQQSAASASQGLRYNNPNDSVFTQGQSAMALLPEMMQLGQITEMRGRLNHMDQESRSFLRKENQIGEDKAVFDDFTKDLNGISGITDPQERAQKMAEMQQRRPDYALNKDAQLTLKSFGEANKAISEAAQEVALTKSSNLQSKLADRHMALDEKIGDAQDAEAVAQFHFGETKAKSERDRFKAAQDADASGRMDSYHSAIVQSSLPEEMNRSLVDLGAVIGDSEKWAGTLSSVSAIASATNDAINIESSYNPYLAKYKGIEDHLGKMKINPTDLFSKDKSVAEQTANKAMSSFGSDYTARRQFQEYYSLQGQKRSSMESRDKMLDYLVGPTDQVTGKRAGGAIAQLTQLAEDGRKNGGDLDDNKMIEFKKLRDQIASKVYPISAGNKEVMTQRVAHTKAVEDNLKINKLIDEVANSESLQKSRNASTLYTEMNTRRIKMNMDKLPVDSVVSAAIKSGIIKKNAKPEDIAKFRSDYEDAVRQGTKSSTDEAPAQFATPE